MIGPAIAVLCVLGVVAGASPATPADSRSLLLGTDYPIEVAAPFHAGLFHWLDSLAGLQGAGMSAGKTIEAHRRDFVRVLGPPSDGDRDVIRKFADARFRYASAVLARREAGEDADIHALLAAFLEAPDEDAAWRSAAALVAPEDLAALRAGMDRFRDRYAEVAGGGTDLDAFVTGVRGTKRARRLESLLTDIAGFYGVELPTATTPRVILTPVAPGYGTHAMAIGRNLLIELRPEDGIAETASVIVHENAHFLFLSLPETRRASLRAVLDDHGPKGAEAWVVLSEAIPTALGQGVADRAFRRSSWSIAQPWYHTDDVDRYAKAIYPLVRDTLRAGGTLDAAFLERAFALRPGAGDSTRR